MKIKTGEMGRLLGLSANGVKLYEQYGIISPPRQDDNGYRLYGANEFQTMGYATQLRRFGFSMQKTAELLNCPDGHVQMDALASRAESIELEIEELIRMRKTLREHVNLFHQSEELMSKCIFATAPAIYFLGMRRGDNWLRKNSIDEAQKWIEAYSPHTYSAMLLDGPYCVDDSFSGEPQQGLAVPGTIALDIGLLPSATVTYMLPKPCVQTAFQTEYDHPDYTEALRRIRSFANAHHFELQGGGLVLVTHCCQSQGKVICNCLLWAPTREEEENQYGSLR